MSIFPPTDKEEPITPSKVPGQAGVGPSDGKSNLLDNDCYGHWKYPRTCSVEDHSCEYFAKWETVGSGDEMRWYIETTHTDTWTGVGFSNDEFMSQTDAIIGWIDRNGRPFLMDTWINGYQIPRVDRQDIYNETGRFEKGATILEFTRKRISNDPQDLSFTDDHCLYLFFPVVGGSFNAVNKKIKKHDQVPLVTPRRVCIKSCGRDIPLPPSATTPEPNQLAYLVGIKLTNLADSFVAPERGTVEFNNLASQISDSFNAIHRDVPGYFKTEVMNFEKSVFISSD